MTKRILIALTALMLIGLLGFAAGCGDEGLPNDAVAKVGESYITQEQLDARVADFEKQYMGYTPDKATDPEGYKEFTLDVLEYLITYEIVSQNADELGVSVTDEQVQEEIDLILSQSFGGDQAAFDEALAAQNMTIDDLKTSYKESMLMQAAYEAVTADVTTVPDEEIAAYYDENKTDYAVDETRTARHILIAPGAQEDSSTSEGDTTTTTAEPTDEDWADALAVAEEVRAKLVAGGDWTTLAAEYSDDPGSKDSGGDLGVVSKGQMVPEFEEAVFSLAVDEISEPIKTVYGYHVIQVTGITEASQPSLDDVKEDITATLLAEKKSQVWEQWLEDQKTALDIVYRTDMDPGTTTTEGSTDSTNTPETTSDDGAQTTTTEAGSPITTAAPETTTTAAP